MGEPKAVLYSCPFVPPEWIAAHGLRPTRVLPRSPEAIDGIGDTLVSLSRMGICSYARAFAREVCKGSDGDAAIFTTTCDQMRRMSELVGRFCDKPIFAMHVPTSCETVAAFRFYREELHRLGRFLIEIGGTEPTPDTLIAAMESYEAMRTARSSSRFGRAGAIPIALVGGPLVSGLLDLFDLVERAGGYVALDATETGERTLPKPFDRRRLKEDPVAELVDAYFGTIPDAFRRPNTLLYQWLKRESATRGIRGIILLHYVWCDTWRAEVGRLKEWAPVPVLVIDTDEGECDHGRIFSRVQAFLEVLAQ